MKLLNEYGAVIGIIGIVFSTVLAIFFYLKTRVKKQIKLNRREAYSLFKKNDSIKIEDIEIYWKKKKIDNIFLFEVFFKNSGTKALKKEDFLENISITFNEEIEILKAKVYSSSQYTKLNWNYEGNKVEVNIDLIEKQNLIRCEITYSSKTISPVDINLKILDGNVEKKKIKKFYSLNADRDEEYSNFTPKSLIRSFLGFLFIILFIVLALFFNKSFPDDKEIHIPTFVLIFLFAFGVFMVVKHSKEYSDYKNINNWIEHKSKNEIDKLNKFVQEYLAEDLEKNE
nr:hypothetical protein [uncultured Draconibacterium sp.]